MRKICIVTSNRADYWLLRPLLRRFRDSKSVSLQIIAAGAHLSDEFGKTVDFIRSDGFSIDSEVECLPRADDHLAMIDAMSRGVSGFARVFQKLHPDMIVILGDRFEIFAAAQAAYCLKIPIAHLYGGELTQAALDDGFRHANSKFSHLHFVAHPEYKTRLTRMGEQPDRIWVVGTIGIDSMNEFKPVSKLEISQSLNFDLDKYILLTYHPSTLDDISSDVLPGNVIRALNEFPEYQVLITQSNPDPMGRQLNEIWSRYSKQYSKRICFTQTLGDYYLSVVYYSQCVLGNSSSGILEVPYLGKRTINIGKRQLGRIFPTSVLQVNHNVDAIVEAISISLQSATPEPEQIYGKPGTVANAIAEVLEQVSLDGLICKEFYDG